MRGAADSLPVAAARGAAQEAARGACGRGAVAGGPTDIVMFGQVGRACRAAMVAFGVPQED